MSKIAGHRLRGFHRRLSRPGAARRRPRGRRPRQLLQVRPRASRYDDHPRYRLVEGDAKDVELMRTCCGLRPVRGRRRHDRRDQLLPRVRVRPAGGERADPRLDVRCRDRGPPARRAAAGHCPQLLDGLRNRRTSFPRRRAPRRAPAAAVHVRLPEARLEYFAKGAWEQYRLPYTILRPFNCVGIGERRALRRHGGAERAT